MATVGVMSIAGLGLIGAGAHAVFTTSTTSTQQITAGTLSMAVSSPNGGSCTASDVFGQCTTWALPAYGPTQSTFDSGPLTVTSTNVGNIIATNIQFSATDPSDVANPQSLALNNEAWVCVTGDNENGTSFVVANELLTAFEASPVAITGTEPPGTAQNTVEIFAGSVSTACGNNTTYGYAVTTGQTYPETLAPSLNNDAEAGVIDPAITISFTG